MEIGDVYVEISLVIGTKTQTEVGYYWFNPGALYAGNKVMIDMEQKTLKAVLVDKIFY